MREGTLLDTNGSLRDCVTAQVYLGVCVIQRRTGCPLRLPHPEINSTRRKMLALPGFKVRLWTLADYMVLSCVIVGCCIAGDKPGFCHTCNSPFNSPLNFGMMVVPS
ncbi:unnamed protein product [Arctogadus glacialis]